MGTSAHVRIHTAGADRGAGVYHRFDGDTLGQHLVALATALNAAPEPVTPLTFAQAWVSAQNDQFRADMARFPDPTGRAAEIVAAMMKNIELVDDEDPAAVPDWHDAYYTVTLVDGRVHTITGHGDTWEPETEEIPDRRHG